MPELPEVETVRRTLEPVMTHARIERAIVRRPNLRTAFPPHFVERLTGQTVLAVTRRAKYLLVDLSSGETLLMHLGMSGSFHITRLETADAAVKTRRGGDPGGPGGADDAGSGGARTDTATTATNTALALYLRADDDVDARHDHVVFAMSSGAIVTFNDPRRFGFMDLVPAGELEWHPVLSALGPEPLSDEFNAETLARAVKGKKTPLKAALLDQCVVSGLGNIYAADALHLAGLSPFRRASTIATPSGLPRPGARRLASAIKKVLTQAIDRVGKETSYRSSSRFRVYDREGERCKRAGCPGTIKRRTQAGRSTFYCPECQR